MFKNGNNQVASEKLDKIRQYAQSKVEFDKRIIFRYTNPNFH